MSKTPHKSLLALALVPTLFAAQLTGLMGTTPAAKATAAPYISLSTSSGTLAAVPQGATITVNGAGFTYLFPPQAANTVVVTLNAPNPANVAGTSQHVAVYPTTGGAFIYGDNTEGPITTATAPTVTNAWVQTILPTGISTGGQLSPAVTFALPSAIAPGTYLVQAYDSYSGVAASQSFTVVASPTLSVYGTGSVALGGQFNVSFQPAAAQYGHEIVFGLMNFAQELTVPTPIAGANQINGLAGGKNFIPLMAVPPAAGNGSNCQQDLGGIAPTPALPIPAAVGCDEPPAGGFLDARLQMSQVVGGVVTPLTSDLFFDQIYTLVAVDAGPTVGVQPPVLTAASTGLIVAWAGIKIDHSLSNISVVSGVTNAGGTVVVNGSGFAANTFVDFWVVDEIGTGACQAVPGTTNATGANTFLIPAEPGGQVVSEYTGQAQNNGYTQVTVPPCNLSLGTVKTDQNGSVSSVSLTMPNGTNSVTFGPVHILAEDWMQITPAAGDRENSGAFASVTLSPTATATGVVLSTSLAGGSAILNQAVPGQTVSYTATGFLASTAIAPEYVTVGIYNAGGTDCSTSAQPFAVGNGTPVLVSTTGVAQGSFVVPTVNAGALGCTPAQGDVLTVVVTGAVSSTGSGTATGTFTISTPAITAVVSNGGASLALTGTGFWAGEAVNFTYIPTQNFSSVNAQPAGTLYADSLGQVSGPAALAPNAAGLSTGYYYVLAAGSTSKWTAAPVLATTNTNGVLNLVNGAVNGGNPVIPGQIVTLTGVLFAQPPVGTIATNSLSVGFAPTPIGPIPVAVDASGNLTGTFTVPAGTTPGTYTVAVTSYIAR